MNEKIAPLDMKPKGGVMNSHLQISAGARLYSELNFSFQLVYDLVLKSEQARNCRPQTDPLH